MLSAALRQGVRFAVSPDLPSGVCVHGLPGKALSLLDLWLDLGNPWITDKLGKVQSNFNFMCFHQFKITTGFKPYAKAKESISFPPIDLFLILS
jgi:hypothetical protein